MQEIIDWFTPRITDLFADGATVTVDKEEITVVGPVPTRSGEGEAAETGDESVADYRERTRAARIGIAREAEELFRRKVSWGVTAGDDVVLFTHLAVPVMTRLRQNERRVLDTLVAGGVARSRSDALAWCVRLVGRHEGDWIARLQEALRSVDEARATGPHAG
ncbi:MAG: hypothetical protein WCA30_19730 [Dermatophilaceae bacterium]